MQVGDALQFACHTSTVAAMHLRLLLCCSVHDPADPQRPRAATRASASGSHGARTTRPRVGPTNALWPPLPSALSWLLPPAVCSFRLASVSSSSSLALRSISRMSAMVSGYHWSIAQVSFRWKVRKSCRWNCRVPAIAVAADTRKHTGERPTLLRHRQPLTPPHNGIPCRQSSRRPTQGRAP